MTGIRLTIKILFVRSCGQGNQAKKNCEVVQQEKDKFYQEKAINDRHNQ
jgi:hypothetical protein